MAWLSGYSRRKKITISNTNVSSTLTDFPLAVVLNENVEVGSSIDSNGYSLRFTSSDGTTLLKYERSYFLVTSGILDASIFVKVPSISSAVPTDIYMYWASSGSDGQDATNVWDSNFVGVYHMQNSPTGSANDITDSTANANHMTSVNMDSSNRVTDTAVGFGGVGYALEFNGTNEYIQRTSAIVTSAPMTMSCLASCDQLGSAANYVPMTIAGNLSNSIFYLNFSDISAPLDTIGAWCGAGAAYFGSNTSATYSANTYYHVRGRWTSSTSRNAYINANGSTTNTNSIAPAGCDRTRIGVWSSSGGLAAYFDGTIQEARYSNVSRSEAWGNFEYYNLNVSGNQLTIGATEVIPLSTRRRKAIYRR